MDAGDLVVRDHRPGDEVEVLAALRRGEARLARVAGGAGPPAGRPRTVEEWRWLHLENPAGRRVRLAFGPDGRLAQLAAGVPRRVVHDGAERTFCQVADVFRDPEAGLGRERSAWFSLVAEAFARDFGGADGGRDAVLYGLPSRSALRLGLAGEVVRSQPLLRLTRDRFASAAPGGVEIVEVEGPFPDGVRELARRCAARGIALAARDPEALAWRFRRPGRTYRPAVARASGGGDVLGLAVLGEGELDGRAGALVCDWLVDPSRPEAGAALRTWLGERAFGGGACALIALLPDTCDEWIAFQRAGYRVEGSSLWMTCRSFARPYGERWLFRSWYYTLADTDLC